MSSRLWRMALAFSCALLSFAVLTPARAQWIALQSPGLEAAAFSPAGRPGLLALASAARILVAGEEEPNGLRVIDPDSGRSLGYMSLSSRVVALAVNASGQRAYLLNSDDWLLVVDLSLPAHPALAATYRLDGDPEALALNPLGGELVVAERERRQIVALDPTTGKVLRSKSFDTAPVKLSYGAGGQRLLVGADQGKLYTLDARTWATVSTVVLGDEIRDLLYWEAGDRAVVVHKRQDGASLVDVVAGQVSRFVPLDGDPDRLSLDAGLERAYITTRDDFSVNRLDVRAARLDGRYVLPGQAGGIAFDASNNHVLVSQPSDRMLLRLNPDQAPLIAVLQLSKRLKDVVANNVTDEAVAVADGSNELTRIRLADRSTQTLALPGRPLRVAVDSVANLALVGLADQTLRLVALSGASPTLLSQRAQLAGRPEALAADGTRHLAVVLTDAKDRVELIDTQSMALLATLRPAEDYDAVAIHSGRGLAYLVSDEQHLGLLALDARSIVQTVQLPFRATAMAVDETLDLAVFSSNEAKVYVLDLTRLTSQVTQLSESDFTRFALPRHPGQLALQPDISLVVTTSEASDAVSLLDLAAGIATPGYSSLPRPSHLAVAARGNQALVLSAERDEVAFIPLPNPLPELTTLTPDHAPLGSAALTLKLTGKHFVGASRVWFGATALTTTYVSAKELSAVLPLSLLALSGSFSVTVRNPAPAGGSSRALAFRVLAPAPLLQQLQPSSLPADAQAHPLTLKGQYFQSGAQVSVSGQWLSASFVSGAELSVQLPVALFAAPADVPLFVLNPDGQTSNLMTLSVVPASPSIDSVSPASGTIGMLVTLTGRNFDPAPANNQVRFSGGPAATVLSASSTQLTLRVPPLSETGPITLTTSRGSAQSPIFTVVRDQDAQLIPSPATVTLLQGASTTVALSLSSTGTSAFTGVASLSATGLPGGVSAKFTPATLSAYQSGALTLSAGAQAAPGSYTLTLNAGLPEAGTTRVKHATVSVTVAAAAGVTGVAGRFVDPQGRGIAGIIVRADTGASQQPQTTTDAAGNFLLTGLPGATITLRMDATPANPLYPIWPYSVTLIANQILALPDWTINPPPTDDKFTAISNASADQLITDPRYPGLAVTLPAGVTITGWDGVKKTRIAVERRGLDKLPVPPPPTNARSAYQLYFGTPMGGLPSAPIPVTLPNDVELEPGEKANIMYYDGSPMGGSGEWKIAGTGTVSADGLSIVSDPGSGIPRFCGVCGLMCPSRPGTPSPNSPKPPKPPECKATDTCCNENGNPPRRAGGAVTLATGQELASAVDLSCQGSPRVGIRRTYNPIDAFNNVAGTMGSLGLGWIMNYDVVLLPFLGPQKRIVLPSNDRVNFVDASGSGQYLNSDDARFRAAVLSQIDDTTWQLKFKDGVLWRFRPFSGVPFTVRGGPPYFLVEEIDTNGVSLTITRNSVGRAVSVGTANRALTFSYGDNGLVQSIRDPLGRSITYTYDANNTVTAITGPDAGVTRYTYVDDSELPATPACPNIIGGQRIKTIQRPGQTQVQTLDYSPSRRVLRETLEDGSQNRFSYTLVGACVTHVSNPSVPCAGPACPSEDSWENFQAGWRISGGTVVASTFTDANGHSQTQRFNPLGTPIQATDGSGQAELYAYDTQNRLTQASDPAGNLWRYTYDDRGNVIQSVDPLGRITDTTYDAKWNKPTRITRYLDDGTPVTSLFQYDTNTGNLIRITDPLGNVTLLSYTQPGGAAPPGLVSGVTDALGHTTSMDYNAAGDLVQVTDALGHTWGYGTDGAGRVIRRTDALGFDSHTDYTPVDQVSRSTDALGGATQLNYYPTRQLASVVDPLNHTLRSYQYDALNRVIQRIDVQGQSERYQYDAAGNEVQLTDRKGQITSYSYDEQNRLLSAHLSDGSTHTRSYDLLDRLTEVREGINAEGYQYDAVGRVTRVTTSSALGSVQLAYTYDALDRIVQRSLSVPGAQPDVTTYAYDRAGRLIAIGYRGQSTTYSWDAASRLVARSLPNGIRQAFSYDEANRLTRIQYLSSAGAVIDTIDYSYDANGQRISRSSSAASQQETAFNALYDQANRLTQITLAPASPNPKTYLLGYDANGNLVSKQNQADATDTTTYTWDSRNRLIAIQGPGLVASFQYDALGRRLSKAVNGVIIQYVYDGAQAIGEIANGQLTATLLTGLQIDEVLARYSQSGSRTYLTDALGSVIAQANVDQSLQNRYSYSPYGEVSASGNDAGNPVQYTARENDGTGLYYYRARYYDPVLKRFIAEDPIGLVGGVNVYGYVEGDPVSYSDPFGTDRWGPTGGKATTNITFDRAAGTITYTNQNGTVVGSYAAGNRTANDNPWPTGTYSFQYWRDHPENTTSYGQNGNFVFDVPDHTGMGIHSGRSGPQSRTMGCIRTTDDATKDLYGRSGGRQVGTVTVK